MNEQALQKQIVVLPGLEGNAPTHLKGLQVPLAPYVDALVWLWWGVFIATVISLVAKNIIVPLAARHRSEPHASEQ